MKTILHVLLLVTALECFAFDELLFKPLEANPIEARIGMLYQPNVDKLRMDIGNSFDLSELINNNNLKLRTGGDFMTFTRLRSVGKLKFPVETTDYYFGINISSLINLNNKKIYTRMRIAHISSHLIDGYTNNWEFIKTPFVYSREFIDLVIAAYLREDFRVYLGTNVVFSTIPKDFSPIEGQIGFDSQRYLNKLFDLEFGYDFRLRNLNNTYYGQNSFQAGLKLKTYENIGLFFGYYFYSGLSIHGLFYDEIDSYHGLGFQIKYK